MKFRAAAISGAALLLGACQKSYSATEVQAFNAGQADEARRAAIQLVKDYGRVLVVCGQSDGLGFYTSEFAKGFRPDGIKDGRMVFLLRSDGRADVVFRDASGRFTSALDDGGDVRIVDDRADPRSWTVDYKSTGITETHSLTDIPDGRLVDLWTSNKPRSLVGANAKLFIAECVRA